MQGLLSNFLSLAELIHYLFPYSQHTNQAAMWHPRDYNLIYFYTVTGTKKRNAGRRQLDKLKYIVFQQSKKHKPTYMMQYCY